MPTLFDPVSLGQLELPNRIVMAPLTRDRATPGTDAPRPLNALYYAQRATAGLIIAEGSQISPEAKGYAWTPGIHSAEQVEGWREVTRAVHDAGGRIVLQLWHCGRISHTSLQPGGAPPVSSSPVRAAATKTFIENPVGFAEASTPRALETDEIPRLVGDFARAAANARDAGFDGVEVHAANGYLIQQFLSDAVNARTDAYGGAIENRCRLLFEIVDAVAATVGAGRTGVRLSPWTGFAEAVDSDPQRLFGHAIDGLDRMGLAYLHLVEGQTGADRAPDAEIAQLRARWRGAYIANNGYTRDLAQARVASGLADAVAFGRPFIANPDLVERFRRDAPLNQGNPRTYYGGDAEGYTDYPFLAAA